MCMASVAGTIMKRKEQKELLREHTKKWSQKSYEDLRVLKSPFTYEQVKGEIRYKVTIQKLEEDADRIIFAIDVSDMDWRPFFRPWKSITVYRNTSIDTDSS